MAFSVITVICQKHTLIYSQIKNTAEEKAAGPGDSGYRKWLMFCH